MTARAVLIYDFYSDGSRYPAYPRVVRSSAKSGIELRRTRSSQCPGIDNGNTRLRMYHFPCGFDLSVSSHIMFDPREWYSCLLVGRPHTSRRIFSRLHYASSAHPATIRPLCYHGELWEDTRDGNGDFCRRWRGPALGLRYVLMSRRFS